MSHHPIRNAPACQDSPPFLVSGSYQLVREHLARCPTAGCLTAWSTELESSVLISTRCRRWSCPHCGPRRIAHLTQKVVDAKPNKLVTLTVATANYETPREAYDDTRRAVAKLTSRIRNRVKEWEYLRILEVTKKGWPHYHFVVRGEYIPQQWLSQAWRKLTGAYIVDIRTISGSAKTASYVMKYLYKQKHVPWTDRRVSWTKQFFVNNDFEKPNKLGLEEVQRSSMNPVDFVYYELQGCSLVAIGPDAWKISNS